MTSVYGSEVNVFHERYQVTEAYHFDFGFLSMINELLGKIVPVGGRGGP
jgi:hypothetical protein